MIRAKKSLGQNFLIDQNIIDKIVGTTAVENKMLLEVGPGTGNLTKALLKKKPKKFFVIEKDNYLASLLKDQFQDEIMIINNDILNFDEEGLSEERLIVF